MTPAVKDSIAKEVHDLSENIVQDIGLFLAQFFK